jgi:uncharacterized protein YjbI with pentapeptide repeats
LALAKSQQDGGVWAYERFNYLVDFNYSDLTDATFIDTSVSGASFRSAVLARTSFSNTDVSRTDFTGGKDLDSAIFAGACFGSAENDRPIGLSASILAKLRSPC